MEIRILHDPDGAYGYPKGDIITGEQFVNDYINYLLGNGESDKAGLLRLMHIRKAIDYVADKWDIDYECVN